MAKAHRTAAPGIMLCLCLLASCSGQREAETLRREDLFTIGYGTSETELDFSSPASDHFDAAMREGIFFFLDTGGKKILKLTSYGDVLSLIYDPKTLNPPAAFGHSGGSETGKGRSSHAAAFVEPSRVAVDSSQTIYVADRLDDPAAKVYDSQSGAYCDRVIRRFGPSGIDAGYLGQEGQGGTPFPFIQSLATLSDDSLVVVAASESLYLVNRYDQSGSLLSSMRIPRSALPVPKALGSKATGTASVYANLDALVPELKGEAFELLVKIDYYRNSATGALPGQGVSYAGSWILSVSGKSGEYENIVQAADSSYSEDIPEFIGVWNDRFFFLSREASDSAGVVRPDRGWSLQSLDRNGRIRGRYRLTLPAGSSELAALKLSPGGQVFGLAKKENEVAVFWWRLDR